jgi:hypothetical protein
MQEKKIVYDFGGGSYFALTRDYEKEAAYNQEADGIMPDNDYFYKVFEIEFSFEKGTLFVGRFYAVDEFNLNTGYLNKLRPELKAFYDMKRSCVEIDDQESSNDITLNWTENKKIEIDCKFVSRSFNYKINFKITTDQTIIQNIIAALNS